MNVKGLCEKDLHLELRNELLGEDPLRFDFPYTYLSLLIFGHFTEYIMFISLFTNNSIPLLLRHIRVANRVSTRVSSTSYLRTFPPFY